MFEMFNLSFMVQAFIACVMMGLILSYLGIHVVGRGIVFVDLALGQISSLGVAFADYIGYGKVWVPIVFTLSGALLLSFLHIKDRRLKLEAIIGIIYAIASAFTVLLISKTPHGEADISEVLFGHILAVTAADMRNMAIVFTGLAIPHAVFFKQIFRLTEKLEDEQTPSFTLRERLWNFFFYLSIGLAIVFAVRAGGVLPVFSYLVIPPVTAVLVARSKLLVVLITFFNAIVASLFGLYVSYTFDFPTGASIVAVFGVMFAGAGILRLLRGRLTKAGRENDLSKA
ncbi:MAG: metal ABC transporter permease [candidate division KSB1 bacterium]|nr:metal ABC transporter permease [candidate division KSB1 bacterium]MDZ7365000.1 metal ABC transporter permease [candidate division KSB1 bacterium]MDZ7403395.1 metal ABC transporter permease [candidate division KSB1 bacterium]